MDNQERQQIIEHLNIDIERLLQELGTVHELDCTIICQSLLGFTPREIAENKNLSGQSIRDRFI